MATPLVRSRFSKHDPLQYAFLCVGPSRTKQEFKDECDVNLIIKRFNATGLLPTMQRSEPRYGDFSDVPSYQDSLNRVMFAQEQFAALPAAVRDACRNDPSVFLQQVNDPAFIERFADALGSPDFVKRLAEKAAAIQGSGVEDPGAAIVPQGVKASKNSKPAASSDRSGQD